MLNAIVKGSSTRDAAAPMIHRAGAAHGPGARAGPQEPNQYQVPRNARDARETRRCCCCFALGAGRAGGRGEGEGEGGGCNRRNGRRVASPQLVLAVAGGTLGGGRRGGGPQGRTGEGERDPGEREDEECVAAAARREPAEACWRPMLMAGKRYVVRVDMNESMNRRRRDGRTASGNRTEGRDDQPDPERKSRAKKSSEERARENRARTESIDASDVACERSGARVGESPC